MSQEYRILAAFLGVCNAGCIHVVCSRGVCYSRWSSSAVVRYRRTTAHPPRALAAPIYSAMVILVFCLSASLLVPALRTFSRQTLTDIGRPIQTCTMILRMPWSWTLKACNGRSTGDCPGSRASLAPADSHPGTTIRCPRCRASASFVGLPGARRCC
jgi:hypothetical protein